MHRGQTAAACLVFVLVLLGAALPANAGPAEESQIAVTNRLDAIQTASATCEQTGQRGISSSGISLKNAQNDVNGVTGHMYVPATTDRLQRGRFSAADIFVRAGVDFVQLGWLRGAASQLPYSTTARAFFGEFEKNSLNDEFLKSYPISIGWHLFELRRVESTSDAYYGHWRGYIDGRYVFVTRGPHPRGTPAINGETSHTCVEMEGTSHNPAGAPYADLAYRSVSQNRYLAWPDNIRTKSGLRPECIGVAIIGGSKQTHFSYYVAKPQCSGS